MQSGRHKIFKDCFVLVCKNLPIRTTYVFDAVFSLAFFLAQVKKNVFRYFMTPGQISLAPYFSN